MNLLTALQWRYAVREFSRDIIAEQDMDYLLQATHLSASSYGLQPYKLIVVTDQKVREALVEHAYGQQKVAQSSHLVVLAADTDIGDHTVDRYIHQVIATRGVQQEELQGYADHMKTALAVKSAQEKQAWANEQVYIALGTLLAAAAEKQIDTCPMTGFDPTGFNRVLNLSAQGLTAVAICAVGKRSADDKAANQQKVRMPYSEFVLRAG